MSLPKILCFQNKDGATVLGQLGFDKGSSPIPSWTGRSRKEHKGSRLSKVLITASNNMVGLVYQGFYTKTMLFLVLPHKKKACSGVAGTCYTGEERTIHTSGPLTAGSSYSSYSYVLTTCQLLNGRNLIRASHCNQMGTFHNLLRFISSILKNEKVASALVCVCVCVGVCMCVGVISQWLPIQTFPVRATKCSN